MLARKRQLILGGCLLVLLSGGLLWAVQAYTAYQYSRQERIALGQKREDEIDRMIEEMKRLYQPGTPAQEIIDHFQSKGVPYFRQDRGGGSNYRCPCIMGVFEGVYEGVFYRTNLYIVVMIDENNRAIDIRKSSSTLSL